MCNALPPPRKDKSPPCAQPPYIKRPLKQTRPHLYDHAFFWMSRPSNLPYPTHSNYTTYDI